LTRSSGQTRKLTRVCSTSRDRPINYLLFVIWCGFTECSK